MSLTYGILTKHLRLGKCRYAFVYHLNGRPIDKVNNFSHIGIHIQSNLKFTTHCNQLVKKAYFFHKKYIQYFLKGIIRNFNMCHCIKSMPDLFLNTPAQPGHHI